MCPQTPEANTHFRVGGCGYTGVHLVAEIRNFVDRSLVKGHRNLALIF